jgi:predicted ArsR family transcriptional regulator
VCGNRQIGNIGVVKTEERVAATAPGCCDPAAAARADDARTRERVVAALHEHGPQTAADLSARFGITSVAVRRHLEGLLAEGRVTEVPERKVRGKTRGRGRPAKLFGLTDAGRNTFPHAYDDLAAAALRYLGAAEGEAAVVRFAHDRLTPLGQRYAAALDGVRPDERATALASALSADGYAASAEKTAGGVQICQHHCPVAHVATEFPQLCEAETELFGRLLGSHVQRLATIAHGDGVCTTFVPGAALVAPPPRPDVTHEPSPSDASTVANTATTSRKVDA